MMTAGTVHAQNSADDIIGYYYVVDPFSDEATQIYIYKTTNGQYEAKITWVEIEEKKHFIGLIFLKELNWDSKKNEWNKGTIIYPGKKGNFSVNMHFQDSKTLKVRGYWGISMMGKTVYWTKEEKKRE